MGFRFRWSKRVLPGVRLNLSKTGASVSLGRRGFWYTIGSKGTRTTVGLPGTGLSWTEYSPHVSGERTSPTDRSCYRHDSARNEEIIDSAPVEAVAEKSTSEIKPLVEAVTARIRFSRLILLFCFVTLLLSIVFKNSEWILISVFSIVIALPIAIVADYYRRTIRVVYDLDEIQRSKFPELLSAFESVRQSKRVWHVPTQQHTSDWKRNAGATSIIKRSRIFPTFRRPAGIRSNVKIPSINVGRQTIQFGPDAVFLSSGKSVAVLSYADVEVTSSSTMFVESESVVSDAVVNGYTWRFANRDGGPDRRFLNNKELPICSYTQIEFQSAGGLNEQIMLSAPVVSNFVTAKNDYSDTSSNSQAIYSSIQFSGMFPSLAVAICGVCISLGVGLVAAGDLRMHSAFKVIVSGKPSAKDDVRQLNIQVPVAPPVVSPSQKSAPQKKSTTPANDPRRAIR